MEHTDLDSYWGDGLDGSGFNVLGKLIGRLLQYARTGDPQWLDFPAEGLHQPAAESILYPWLVPGRSPLARRDCVVLEQNTMLQMQLMKLNEASGVRCLQC